MNLRSQSTMVTNEKSDKVNGQPQSDKRGVESEGKCGGKEMKLRKRQ